MGRHSWHQMVSVTDLKNLSFSTNWKEVTFQFRQASMPEGHTSEELVEKDHDYQETLFEGDFSSFISDVCPWGLHFFHKNTEWEEEFQEKPAMVLGLLWVTFGVLWRWSWWKIEALKSFFWRASKIRDHVQDFCIWLTILQFQSLCLTSARNHSAWTIICRGGTVQTTLFIIQFVYCP